MLKVTVIKTITYFKGEYYVKNRPIFAHEAISKRNYIFYRFWSHEYDNVNKKFEIDGNTLKIEYKHDIFKEISLFFIILSLFKVS